MLKSMSLLFSKDPQKIFQFYDVKADDKNKIIQRLWQLEAYPELLEIVKMDNTVREYLLNDMMKANLLDLQNCEQILVWLNVSKLQSDLINYIKNKFNVKEIEQIIKNGNLNPNARKNLEKIAIQKSTNTQAGFKYIPDERYMKLRMILEDSDWFEENQLIYTQDLEEIDQPLMIKTFLENYTFHNHTEKMHNVRDFIINNRLIENDQEDLMNIIINLADFSYREKIRLLSYLNHPELYKPEFFIPYTDFYYHDFELLQPVFSQPVIKSWIQHYYSSSWLIDLLWLRNNYEQFEWISEFINNNALGKVFENQNISEIELLTTRLNYTLTDIIKDANIMHNLTVSSSQLEQFITHGINDDLFDLEFYLKPLIIVGGEKNFNFINKLLSRTPVESIKEAYDTIEKKHLKVKRDTEDANKLKETVNQEIKEKEGLIFAGHYQIAFQLWIETVSRLNFISPKIKSFFVENLPDIKAYLTDCDKESKLIICKLISSLQLMQFKNVLEQMIKSDDYTLQIHAIAALKNIEHSDMSKHIKSFSESQNILVKQEFSRSLNLFRSNLDDSILIKLISDSNPLVSEYALNHVSTLSKDKALKIIGEIINKIPSKNRGHLAKILGNFRSPKSVKLLIDLLNHGDSNLYKIIIQSLIKINHPTSLVILQNMDLNKNFILEMERARALILLGDYNGWNHLRKYFNISHSSIQNLAKMIYIELSGMDQIRAIQRLSNDKNPLIAAYASIKIFYFNELEGQALFDATLQKNDIEKLYYLTMVIEQLPYNQNKNKILLIYRVDSVKCKTIAALVSAKNGDFELFKLLDKEIFRMDESSQEEMLSAIFDYPVKQAYPFLIKLCQLQNPKIIRKIIDLIHFFEIPKNDLFLRELWFKSNSTSMIALIDYIIDSHNDDMYNFIKTQLKAVPFEVQTHIARAMIQVENQEEAWKILETLIREDDLDIKKSAMDALSKIEDVRSFEILCKFTASPIEEIQIELIKAISNTGNPESLIYLSKMSDSSSSRVKITLAKSLGNLPFNESKQILEKLKIDRDEYVKVQVDISLEKIDKGSDPDKVPFLFLIYGIFKESSWILSEVWFEKEYNMFKSQYSNFSSKPLNNFNRKVVLEQEDFFEKEQLIKMQVEKQLLQNTDVENIVQIKKAAEIELSKLVIKEELIISLLELVEVDLKEAEYQILFDIISADDEDLIKSILLNSCKSGSSFWFEYLFKIINSKYSTKFIDLIIFSLFKKDDFRVLVLFSQLLGSERGRYYFIYLINYYIIYQKKILPELADSIYRNITHSAIDPNQKKSLADIVQKMFTVKGLQ